MSYSCVQCCWCMEQRRWSAHEERLAVGQRCELKGPWRLAVGQIALARCKGRMSTHTNTVGVSIAVGTSDVETTVHVAQGRNAGLALQCLPNSNLCTRADLSVLASATVHYAPYIDTTLRWLPSQYTQHLDSHHISACVQQLISSWQAERQAGRQAWQRRHCPCCPCYPWCFPFAF